MSTDEKALEKRAQDWADRHMSVLGTRLDENTYADPAWIYLQGELAGIAHQKDKERELLQRFAAFERTVDMRVLSNMGKVVDDFLRQEAIELPSDKEES